MNYNWRKGGIRGGNCVEAHPQRLTSADGMRWALGRYVKRSLPDHRWDAVEVWTLKDRHLGKARTVDTQRSKADAEAWVRS